VDNWIDQDAPAELERVRSDIRGGAFPHPPVLPVVAVVALLFGLSLGAEFSPKPGPTVPTTAGTVAPPSATISRWPGLIANPTAPATIAPATDAPTAEASAATPPAEGTTVAVAVTAAEKTFGIKPQDVLSVRLANGTSYLPAIDGWVWEILVRGRGSVECGHVWVVRTPIASHSAQPIFCDESADVVIVDYASGTAVIMASATYP
jgi:hypothetical protein